MDIVGKTIGGVITEDSIDGIKVVRLAFTDNTYWQVEAHDFEGTGSLLIDGGDETASDAPTITEQAMAVWSAEKAKVGIAEWDSDATPAEAAAILDDD